MSLFSKILSEVNDFAAFIVDDHRSGKLLAEVRREHDAWMRTAQLHTPYYTVNPTVRHRNDLPHTRDEHDVYVFTRRGAFGLPNQLITASGSPSWRLWVENGPFTLTPKPTAASLREADERVEARNLAAMQQRVTADVMAELERQYPASLALHR